MATSPEVLLLSAVCRTRDHKALIKTGITADMFHQHPEIGKWLFTYITRHRKAPSRTAAKTQFPGLSLYRTDDVEYYADEVRREHAQHALMTTLDQVVDAVEEADYERAMRVLQIGMNEVQVRSSGVSEHYDAFDDWASTYAEVAARVDRVTKLGYAGVPTGFDTLDALTGGLQPGWFCVVAARLGQGKTWTGIRMGFAAAVLQNRVLYYSLEQSRHQVAMRLHSFASAIHAQNVFNSLDLSRGRGFDLLEYKKFLQDLREAMGDGGFSIVDRSRGTISPGTIAAGIESMNPDVVYIDYLTLMGQRGDDWRATAQLSADCQGLAQRYQIPIVGLAQINRTGAGKEPPGPEALSQADAIGQDADVLVTMAQQSKSVMKMKLAKFRHGPDQVSWYALFDPARGKYQEISGDEAEEQREADMEVD